MGIDLGRISIRHGIGALRVRRLQPAQRDASRGPDKAAFVAADDAALKPHMLACISAGEANGWIKEVGGMAQAKFRGMDWVDWMFTFKAAASNLIRTPALLATG